MVDIVQLDKLPTAAVSLTSIRSLSLLQLLLLNCIVCGLEFCASAAFTYIPPMLLKAGLSEQNMTVVLGIGPLLGFLLVPVIGRASDQCRSKYGRRKPFIFGLSVMVVISLLIIPYGELFGIYALGNGTFAKPFGLFLLILGSVMLDFSSQACLTPCEALLSDACRNTGQQDTCFTVYSFMVSLGGCIGYLITALDWSSNSVGLYFGGQEQSAFSLLIVLFIMTTCASLGIVEEQQASADEDPAESALINVTLDQIHKDIVHHKDSLVPKLNALDPGYESGSSNSQPIQNGDVTTLDPFAMQLNNANITSICPKTKYQAVTIQKHRTSDKIISTVSRCLSQINFTTVLSVLWSKIFQWLPKPLSNLLTVPHVLRHLAFANFCGWTAVMSFNLFFTDFVGQAVFGGDPNAPDGSELQQLYNAGVRHGSWGLLYHCVFSALSAAFIEQIVRKWGFKNTYIAGMASFSAAMCVLIFTRNALLVNMMASLTGFAYATLTTIPFMLVSNYHDNKELFFYDERLTSGQSPERGIGADMATLDSAYFLSQALLSAFMGAIVQSFGSVIAYIVVSCSAGIIACVFIYRIVFTKQQMINVIREDKLRTTQYVDVEC